MPYARQAADEARRRSEDLKQAGVSGRETVAVVVAETGLPRREVYQLWARLL